MLAFFNRHLPLTEAQRSQLLQSQVASGSTSVPGTSARGDSHLAALSHHMSSSEHQATDRGQDATSPVDQSMVAQESGLRPSHVVLDGLSDGLSGNLVSTGRTYESRVKPEERKVFEDICRGNIAILDLCL